MSDAEQRTGLDLAEVSRLAAEAAYRSGTLGRADSLLAEALARLPAAASPVRRALLLERHAVIQRDSGRQPAAVASLEQGLALLPADGADASRAHAVLLATLAGVLMRGSEMERAADVARRAVAAARAAGAREAEADAAITLGLGMAYLDEPEAGLESLRAGVRAGPGAGHPADRDARLREPLRRGGAARPARGGRPARPGRAWSWPRAPGWPAPSAPS